MSPSLAGLDPGGSYGARWRVQKGSGSGGKSLPAEVLDQIVAKTDGVPLFLEELTKMVLESDMLREESGEYKLVGSLPSLTIPSTLQDSLMARL
ncbi:MAG: hypothetical protein IH827_02310, partial [Myxococcales bacterium]|nr:hypothetical protein [Myxococcales bacterium]